MNTDFPYGEYIKTMYQKGFYIERYSIGLMSYEVICDYNKIVVVPAPMIDEEIVMIFTGTSQKISVLSEPTEFRLSLFDKNDVEFRDSDYIMMSVVKVDDRGEDINNLFTRSYAQWKFGQIFEKGIELNSEKYLLFQTQKEIGRFDIDIIGIDLFRRKTKAEKRDNRMTWLD